MSCPRKAMSQARAPDVGLRTRVAGQVGDPTDGDPAHQETGAGELRRSVLREVAE